MVDHARTLLLNVSSVDAQGIDGMPWSIDPAYLPVPIEGALDVFYDDLFQGTRDIAGRVRRVDEVMQFLTTPEFSRYLRILDPRQTVVPEASMTVSGFASRMTGEGAGFVVRCVDSHASRSLFSNDPPLNSAFVDVVSKLGGISSSSLQEERFAANVMAYLFHLESLRLASGG